MSQYILVIIWPAVLYLISQMVNIYKTENVLGKEEVRVTTGFAIISILPLIYWTATRGIRFGDTYLYMKGFEEFPSTLKEIPAYMVNVEKDKGFRVFGIVLKTIIEDNVQLYFGIIAAIQVISLAVVFRKYSSNYVMAIYIFIASTDYLSWMHNGIRQFIAVTLIFATTEWMIKKNYVPMIIIILLASTIHGSALMMIPVAFIVQGSPWNKKTMLAILAFVLAIVFVDRFTVILDDLLTDTQYTNVVSHWQLIRDDGTNPIRVLIYSIPTLLSIVGYRHIKVANDPIINLACNMGIISTMLYCLSMVTSGIFIGRLPIYCSLYAMGILLPWELENIFSKESSRLIKFLMVASFLGFYCYQTHFIWGLI